MPRKVGHLTVKKSFTTKQLKFIELYNGNGTETARLAGYKGDDTTLSVTAYDNLRNPRIVEAIKKRHDVEMQPAIMTRVLRQKFWQDVLKDETLPMKERIRASELLGKSEGDFIEVVKVAEPIKHEIKIVDPDQVKKVIDEIDSEC